MFTIIDRYIGKTFLSYFIGGLLVFVTLFVAIDFMTNAVRFDVAGEVLARYYGNYTFEIIYKMFPVACLLATLFTLGHLNKSSELTALFSMGRSLMRITLPIWVLIAIISLIGFVFSDQIIPNFVKNKNYIYFVEMKKRPGLFSTVKTNKIWYRSKETIFNIKLLDVDERKAFGITLYEFSPRWRLQQLILAEEANLLKDRWELVKGTVTVFLGKEKPPLVQTFERKTVALDEDIADIQTNSSASQTMTLKELNRYIKKNKEAGLNTTEFEVDYYAKFSFALAAFIMSFLSVPFAVGNNRSGGNAIGMTICMGLTFAYWTLYSSGVTLGRYGVVNPMWAVWLPNFLMLGFGLFQYRKMRR